MFLGTKGRLVLILGMVTPPVSEKGAKLGVFAYFDVEHILFVRFRWGFFYYVPMKIRYLIYVNGFNVAFMVLEIYGAQKG